MSSVRQSAKDALVANRLISPASRWQAMSGGRTNRVWRVDDPAGILVCKLFDRDGDNPLYPNLPGAEYETLKALHNQGIAPEPVGLLNTSEGKILVYRHIDGHEWRSDVQAVARLLARVHVHDESLPLRNIPSGSAALVRQTLEILASCKTGSRNIPQSFPHRDVPPVFEPRLIHTDVVPNNIIQTTEGLRLIDWQCPGLGDPCEDLASFISPSMQYLYGADPLDDEQKDLFLAAYGDPLVGERYRRLEPIFHWRSAAYCLWKTERGDSDYKHAMELEISALKKSCDENNNAGKDHTDANISRRADF